MTIVPHDFQSLQIDQAFDDFKIGQIEIPKGYVNLTQLCKAGKKKLNDYTRLKRSEAYIEALSADAGIPASALIIEVLGGGDGSGAREQGTWGHHLIALSVCSWISPTFELWGNKVLWSVINNDFVGMTQEAALQKEKLQDLFDEIRGEGIHTRRSLTVSIPDRDS